MTHMPRPFDGLRLSATQPGQPPQTAPMPMHDAPVHDATVLTHGGVVAHIRLHAQLYTLRITRQGKLILTK